MKVFMAPRAKDFAPKDENGIRRVCEAYEKYLPEFGVEFVDDIDKADLLMDHAGSLRGKADLACNHGLYWSADLPHPNWEMKANRDVIMALRCARQVTVPSRWVAHNIARDMRFLPHVVPHGIDWQSWQGNVSNQGFVLWNKNRVSDACDPLPMYQLAERFSSLQFVTTFLPKDAKALPNVVTIGVVPHSEMMRLVKSCKVYLSTTKETFCLGALEAMASGKPILSIDAGAVPDMVRHGVNGYLYPSSNRSAMEEGLGYCLQHANELGSNSLEISKGYTWRSACAKLYRVIEMVMDDIYEAW